MTAALLDTQPLLWALADDPRLPAAIAERIRAEPEGYGVSDVCLWEIAIKRSIGKLRVPDDLPRAIAEIGFSQVAITRHQVWAVGNMPLHHRDPFDRLLVAQAMDLDLPVVSSDRALADYDIAVVWEQLDQCGPSPHRHA